MKKEKELKENTVQKIDGLSFLGTESLRQEILNSRIPVLLEVRADWSGSCQIMSPIMKKMSDSYKGKILFLTVRIETRETLIKEFSVNELPIYLFYKEGQLENNIIGAVSQKEMETVLGELIYEIEKKGEKK